MIQVISNKFFYYQAICKNFTLIFSPDLISSGCLIKDGGWKIWIFLKTFVICMEFHYFSMKSIIMINSLLLTISQSLNDMLFIKSCIGWAFEQ